MDGDGVGRHHVSDAELVDQLDVYFASYKEMANFNSHYETIYRVSFPFGMPEEGE